MAIYNTITIAPSGSDGWGSSLTDYSPSVDYFYAPYEGSFLYANSGNFIQPFPEVVSGQGGTPVSTYDASVSQPFGTLFPFTYEQGRSILKFYRLSEQNPQITPAKSYYPYNPETGVTQNQQIAEYASLPSVHLKMTIQPVRFPLEGNLNMLTTAQSIESAKAEYSPLYVEMIGTSNAAVNHPSRASNYVETSYLNNETLTSDIHVYQWEEIKMSSFLPSSLTNYDLEQVDPVSDTLFPLGTRDLYFEAQNPATSNNGNPSLIPFSDLPLSTGYKYASEITQLIFSNTDDYANAGGYYRNKLITTLRSLPPIWGQHLETENGNTVSGGVVPGNPITSIAVDDTIEITSQFIPSLYSLQPLIPILHPPIYTNGSPSTTQPVEPNPIPAQVILNFRTKPLYNTSPEPSISDSTEIVNNQRRSLWHSSAICKVEHYETTTNTLKVKVLKIITVKIANNSEVPGEVSLLDNIQATRILIDAAIPNLNQDGKNGFNNICQFSSMISHLGNYYVDELHFRAAYCAYSYMKHHQYISSTGQVNPIGELNSSVLNPIDNPNPGGGFYYDVNSFSYSPNSNIDYVSDRNSFFGTTAVPFNTVYLADNNSCIIDDTIKFNPHRFGLVYDPITQEFSLQIPRIGPCIIKGTYQVF